MKVLVVKTSSMGDIIHALPALTDARKALPEIEFDWVVEKSFAEIPAWHFAVKRIIPVAIRRWRRNLWRSLHQGHWQQAISQIREQNYDVVIDAQGLLKSAMLARCARGKLCGYDFKSIREPVAAFAYPHRFQVSKAEHAVTRIRQLFAKALEYPLPESMPDYGIAREKLPAIEYSDDYLVFLHGTSWANKHWPEQYWCDLLALAQRAGFQVLLPWGNEAEQQRAQRIAASGPGAKVLPRMSLSELAAVLANARGTISVDTGLGHLAAALAVPTVSLFGPTDPELSRTYGANQHYLRANFDCAPCMQRRCKYKGISPVQPACFATLSPTLVWQKFLSECATPVSA